MTTVQILTLLANILRSRATENITGRALQTNKQTNTHRYTTIPTLAWPLVAKINYIKQVLSSPVLLFLSLESSQEGCERSRINTEELLLTLASLSAS